MGTGAVTGKDLDPSCDLDRELGAGARLLAFQLEKAQAKAQGKREQTKARFREGSKAAQVYTLLCRPEGATVRQIQDLTGWQRHSVRGFLSASARKQGRSVRSFERQGERVYRVKS